MYAIRAEKLTTKRSSYDKTYDLLFVVEFSVLIAYITYEPVILVDMRRAGHFAECRDLKTVQRKMGHLLHSWCQRCLTLSSHTMREKKVGR